jgi:hypothetical protein
MPILKAGHDPGKRERDLMRRQFRQLGSQFREIACELVARAP